LFQAPATAQQPCTQEQGCTKAASNKAFIPQLATWRSSRDLAVEH